MRSRDSSSRCWTSTPRSGSARSELEDSLPESRRALASRARHRPRCRFAPGAGTGGATSYCAVLIHGAVHRLVFRQLPGRSSRVLRLREPARLRARARMSPSGKRSASRRAVVGQTIATHVRKGAVLVGVRQRNTPSSTTARRRRQPARLRPGLARRPDACDRSALGLFDLDDFRSINDLHGHPTGDIVLRAAAHAAQRPCAGRLPRADRRRRVRADRARRRAAGAERLCEHPPRSSPPRCPSDRAVGVTFAWAASRFDAVDAQRSIRAAARTARWRTGAEPTGQTRNLPSRCSSIPSTVIEPPRRRSQTMSQWTAESFAPPLSG